MQRASIAALAALAAVLTTSAAAAQNTSVHARGSFLATYTDNVLAAPDEPITGDSPRLADVFFQVTPGLVLLHESGRVQLSATYEHPVTLYVLDEAASIPPNYGSANTSSDVGSLISNIAVSQRDEMIVGVNASRLTTRQITLSNPEQAGVGAQLDSDNTVATVGLLQNLAHTFGPSWSGTESVNANVVTPLDSEQATRWFAAADIGASYLSGYNLFSARANHTYVSTAQRELLETCGDATNPECFVTNSTVQLLNTFNLSWRRDLAPAWSMELGAGLATAYAPDAEEMQDPEDPQDIPGFYAGPVFSGSLNYTREGYAVDLIYNRGLVPNPLAGPTSVSDNLQLVGRLPLYTPWEFTLQGSAGGSYNQIFSADLESAGSALTIVSDVALRIDPPDMPNFSLRYQHVQQIEVETTAALRAFHTNQISFGIGYNLPARRQERRIRASANRRRVDGSDSVPLGSGSRAAPDPGPNRGLE